MDQTMLNAQKLYHQRHRFGFTAFLAALLSMPFQIFSEELGIISYIANTILIIVFVMSAGISFYFSNFYSLKPDQPAIEASKTKNAQEFWKEAKKRKRLFFITWVCWLIAGPILTSMYSKVLPSEDPMLPMATALFTYGAFWFWTGYRFTSMKCFHCGGKAFDHVFTFTKHMKCKSCGTAYILTDK